MVKLVIYRNFFDKVPTVYVIIKTWRLLISKRPCTKLQLFKIKKKRFINSKFENMNYCMKCF